MTEKWSSRKGDGKEKKGEKKRSRIDLSGSNLIGVFDANAGTITADPINPCQLLKGSTTLILAVDHVIHCHFVELEHEPRDKNKSFSGLEFGFRD